MTDTSDNPDNLRSAEQAWDDVTAADREPASETPRGGFLRRFLAENWAWIVFPALLALLLVVIAFVVLALGDGETTRPFVYAN